MESVNSIQEIVENDIVPYFQFVSDKFEEIDKELGGYIGFLGFESQTGINNAMPVRDMGYHYTALQKQVRDLLDIPEEQKEFWEEYLQDYKIGVIHMQHQPEEIRQRYQSDYRVIADYLEYSDQGKAVLMAKMRENATRLVHPEQTCDLLRELSGDVRFEMMKDIYLGYSEEEKGEKNRVCDLLDAVEEVGLKRGISQGISQGISRGISQGIDQHMLMQVCKKLKRNKNVEEIAEELEEDRERIREMCEVAEIFAPEYDLEQVIEAWEKREQ